MFITELKEKHSVNFMMEDILAVFYTVFVLEPSFGIFTSFSCEAIFSVNNVNTNKLYW